MRRLESYPINAEAEAIKSCQDNSTFLIKVLCNSSIKDLRDLEILQDMIKQVGL